MATKNLGRALSDLEDSMHNLNTRQATTDLRIETITTSVKELREARHEFAKILHTLPHTINGLSTSVNGLTDKVSVLQKWGFMIMGGSTVVSVIACVLWTIIMKKFI